MTRPASFAAQVIAWQRRHGRHGLPWQGTQDPYRVWLSEVMLQQTQVATVQGYYGRFLQRFPTLQALAEAPLDDVLALWSGLGYYSRARNLHRCAQGVVQQHGGAFPRSAAALAELPGIGRSTAAAIAAICFGERVAILDGNVKRVLARALGFADDLADASAVNRLWHEAEALLPARGIDVYTQGLMDLGATVCLARSPRCTACPLAGRCAARALGRPEAYPVKRRRARRGQRRHALLWLQQRGRWWLTQRPARGVWGGLWCLPMFDDAAALHRLVATWPGQGEALPAIRHTLTHFDWTLEPSIWRLPARLSAARAGALQSSLESACGAGRWVSAEEALALGLPAPLRRLFEQR